LESHTSIILKDPPNPIAIAHQFHGVNEMSLVTPEVDELVVPSLILFDPDAFTVNLAAILLGSLSMRIKCWPAVEAAGSVTVAWSVMKYTVEVPLIVAPLGEDCRQHPNQSLLCYHQLYRHCCCRLRPGCAGQASWTCGTGCSRGWTRIASCAGCALAPVAPVAPAGAVAPVTPVAPTDRDCLAGLARRSRP